MDVKEAGSRGGKARSRNLTKKQLSDSARHAALERWSNSGIGRHNARVKLNKAIKIGKLERLPCNSCGEQKSEAYHPDYSFPLDVVWLCKKHHSELHETLNRKRFK